MDVILRQEYLDKLIMFKSKKLIKVITGVRRCGKSTLMSIFQSYLLETNVSKEQIISLNFEDLDNDFLLEPKYLHDYLKDKLVVGKMTYIFLDEIQNVREFQKVVDSLYIKDNIDIYLTGSNAHMLSGDLATLLTGRYVEIKMLPLSFKEFVGSNLENKALSVKYREYLEYGSFPYVVELGLDSTLVNTYLEGLYSTIVLKDIISRYQISDVMLLESIIRFVFHNIGSLFSTKKVSDFLNSNGRKTDVRTIERYLQALIDSYIIYQVKRYNIKGKQYLKTLDKYYVVDIGMRNMILGNTGTDIGHMLENIVYLELIRRGYKVYVGKVDALEVDFVAMNQDGISYFQVSATTRDEATLKRELESLKQINDHHPKFILTLDDDPDANFDGIRKINAIDWLMKKG